MVDISHWTHILRPAKVVVCFHDSISTVFLDEFVLEERLHDGACHEVLRIASEAYALSKLCSRCNAVLPSHRT